MNIVDEQSFNQTHDDKTDEKVNVVTEANTKTLTGFNCSRQMLEYENRIKGLEEQLNLPLYSKILTTDKSCKSFAKFDNLELFHKFHDIIVPLVRRSIRLFYQTQTKRQFIQHLKRWEKKGNYLQKMNFY